MAISQERQQYWQTTFNNNAVQHLSPPIQHALADCSIITAYRGSKTHGTYVMSADPDSTDDIDVMAICVPEIDHYFGLKKFGRQGTKTTQHNEWDIVLHEATKFIRMLSGCNPNVLPLLWLRNEDYISVKPAGELILEQRDLFMTQALYKPFVCYAADQLRRMEKAKYQGYMGQKRKALVKKFGYDTKMASHTIRLLRMADVALRTGRLQVFREDDAEELLDIKMGKWVLEEVMEETESLFGFCKDALIKSPLPEEPDMDQVNELSVDVVKLELQTRGDL